MPPVPLPRWIRQGSGWRVVVALALVMAAGWRLKSKINPEPQIRGHGISEWLAAMAGRNVPGITITDGAFTASIGEASHAAYLLGEFGTNAPSARWALEYGAKCPHPPLAEACRRALQVSKPAP